MATVENIDVTDIVGGHLNYNRRLDDVLRLLNLNSSVVTAFHHRAYDEPNVPSFKNRIPDMCLSSLVNLTLAHEELERVHREENSLSAKILNALSPGSKENDPFNDTDLSQLQTPSSSLYSFDTCSSTISQPVSEQNQKSKLKRARAQADLLPTVMYGTPTKNSTLYQY